MEATMQMVKENKEEINKMKEKMVTLQKENDALKTALSGAGPVQTEVESSVNGPP